MKKGKEKKRQKKDSAPHNTDLTLSNAIKDLEEEIKKASKKKIIFKKTLGAVSGAIDVNRAKEKELQEKIAKLMQREAYLRERKKKLEGDLDSVSEKINKISKIRAEIKDI